jgi:TPR repeat protein
MRIALAVALLACAGAPERGGPAAAAPDEGLAGRCSRGVAGACRDLARAELARGAEVRDERLAAALLAEACEQGDPAGCGDLGVLYAIGCGVAQSDTRATALSRRACEQGAALACSNLGTLLAEGVSPGREAAGDREARAQRLFRTACDAGVPEGCANLGAALEAGRGGPRDLRAAARAEKRACDAGLPLACHRLALLIAERPDAAPDVTATALEARACRAAIAPACAAVSERTPPPTARTPAARLVDDRSALALGIPGTGGFSPGELAPARGRGASLPPEEARRPPEALVAKVPAALRSALGLELAARREVAEDPAVERLLALRRHQLGQCHEAPRAPGAPATEAYAVLFLDRDGRPVDVAAASTPAEPAIDACVADLVRGWEFPASHGDLAGPYLVRAAFAAALAGPAPAYAGPGALKPALRDPRCVERAVRVAAENRGAAGSVTVKLAVDAAGRPGLVHALTPAPEAILAAVEAAVMRCPFEGGADAEGRPATLWLTLTVNLSAR